MHSDFPGTTQANELAGGSPAYARKAVTWDPASGGIKFSSNAQIFDIPPLTSVRWIGYTTAGTGGASRCVSPNGAAPKEFQIDITGNFVLLPGHTYVNGDNVVFYGGTPPGGLTAGVICYVVGSVTDKFQVAATVGGAAIDLTSQAAPDCVVSIIVTETYGRQGTMTLDIGEAFMDLND